ncbi:MAG: ATP-binding protein [Eubacteriaceae bacterium]
MDTVKLILPEKPEYVRMIRLSIAGIASQMGFSIDEIEDLKVAVSEACTNAICHGSPSDEETYEVVFEITEEELRIIVSDSGIGFEPDSISQPNLTGEQTEGGFGLYIIKSLMDSVVINSEKGVGTSIIMMKKLAKTNEI